MRGLQVSVKETGLLVEKCKEFFLSRTGRMFKSPIPSDTEPTSIISNFSTNRESIVLQTDWTGIFGSSQHQRTKASKLQTHKLFMFRHF